LRDWRGEESKQYFEKLGEWAEGRLAEITSEALWRGGAIIIMQGMSCIRCRGDFAVETADYCTQLQYQTKIVQKLVP
jgi:hypothetical protein